jgi:hypothetical protein
MRQLHFYLFGFAALVTACQPVAPTTVNTAAAPNIATAPDRQTEINIVVRPVSKNAKSEAGTDSEAGTRAATTYSADETAIAAIPATPPFLPKAMIGSASIILMHDLGIATMVRQEGPIEIWQYRFAECVVDFFFYPASQGSPQLIIKNWDMRSAVIGGRVNEGKCLAAMDQHHRKLVVES